MITGHTTRELRIRELEDLKRRIKYRLQLLNGGIAAMEQARMVAWLPEEGGEPCDDAEIVVHVTACGSALSGATVELLDADDNVIDSDTGSSVTFSGLDGEGTYSVRISKTGYRTRTSGAIEPGCGGSEEITVDTWPSTYSLTIRVRLGDAVRTCGLPGATVAVTGDGSGSDTTDSDGYVTLSLSSSSTAELQSLSYTVTPPSGHGAASKTGTFSIHACSPTAQNVDLIPSTGHVAVIYSRRYMPETLHWEDDYGACDIVWGLPGHASAWTGSYTYESTHAIVIGHCDENPFDQRHPDETANVTVGCGLVPWQDGTDCDSHVMRVGRRVNFGVAAFCVGIGEVLEYRCQPIDDDDPGLAAVPPGYGDGTPAAYDETAILADDDDIAIGVDYGPVPDPTETCGEYEESGVHIDITGTTT